MRGTTTAALTAKAIRKELKQLFPNIKFSVTSESYSMGNSVNIRYIDGVPTKQIEEIVSKYEYGQFNPMEDIYEITNSRDDIPQVKYLFTRREYSEDAKKIIHKQIVEKFGKWDSRDLWKAMPNGLRYDDNFCRIAREITF